MADPSLTPRFSEVVMDLRASTITYLLMESVITRKRGVNEMLPNHTFHIVIPGGSRSPSAMSMRCGSAAKL